MCLLFAFIGRSTNRYRLILVEMTDCLHFCLQFYVVKGRLRAYFKDQPPTLETLRLAATPFRANVVLEFSPVLQQWNFLFYVREFAVQGMGMLNFRGQTRSWATQNKTEIFNSPYKKIIPYILGAWKPTSKVVAKIK